LKHTEEKLARRSPRFADDPTMTYSSVRFGPCAHTLTALCALIASPPAFADAASSVQALHALFDSAWERDLEESPQLATSLGDPRYNDRWDDLSLAAFERRNAADQRVLDHLARIPRDELPAAEQLNYDLFKREYQNRIEAHALRAFLFATVSHQGGVQTLNETAELLPFAMVKDYEDWIVRLERIGAYVDQTITLMRAGLDERRTKPKVLMQRIPAQIALQVVEDPEQSPFYEPFKRFPGAISAPDRERLARAGKRAIAAQVVPAYRRFQRFFIHTYLPAAREHVGIWSTPNGDAYYRNRAAYFTTTALTPDEIHALGLAEVVRIRAEMDKIIAQLSFKGSFEEFLSFLRTDPRFYYQTPEELFEAYAALCKRIDPELVRLFGKLPRTPYGVRPIPMTSAPNTTTAYYQPLALDGSRPGYYYVNLYQPEVRPKYEMEVLTVHEAVPGHHLQLALQAELGTMPLFRRNAGHTAYVEGWGLYAESLGDELGLYRDPYSKFGQLTYEMWRAVRLVVDTGLHYKHWTREQAIDYFMSNAAKTEADIINEIDRYIDWPGQALAYKIGELKIKELRALAQRELGEDFDIRAFHDTVLGTGAVPLDVLERTVREWIAARRSDG
jgi:uncharacterized protein (DUF885 family)